MSGQTRRLIVLLCAPALLGVVVALYVTRWGVGQTPDSASYVAAAKSLREGRGVSAPDFQKGDWAPMTHWPPLLPTLLSAISLAGVELLEAARWLNALMLGGTCVLAGLLVHRLAPAQRWLALLAALAVANSAHLLDVHLMAWTEPLFCLLTLLSLLLLSGYVDRPRLFCLVASAAAAALAMLTRYLGIVLVGSAVLSLLVLPGRKGRRRVLDGAVFGLVSCVPPGLWMLRNHLSAGSAANRGFAVHPIGWEKIRAALVTVSRWFLPESIPEPARVALAAGVLVLAPVLAVLLARCASRRALQGRPEGGADEAPAAPHTKTAIVLAVFAAAYLAFLAVSISFLDALTPLDNRILSPLSPLLLALVFGAGGALAARFERSAALRLVVLLLLVAFTGWKAQKSLALARGRDDSEGFSTRAWRASQVMASVANLPGDRAVYSNCPEAIYLLTGRVARLLPRKANPYTLAPNGRYDEQLARMARDLTRNRGLLVFVRGQGREYLPSERELTSALPQLVPIQTGDQARLYARPEVP